MFRLPGRWAACAAAALASAAFSASFALAQGAEGSAGERPGLSADPRELPGERGRGRRLPPALRQWLQKARERMASEQLERSLEAQRAARAPGSDAVLEGEKPALQEESAATEPSRDPRASERALPGPAEALAALVDRLKRGRGSPAQGELPPLLLLLAGLASLLLLLRLLRRPGDLVVSISYPPALKGSFSVQIARRKGALRRTGRERRRRRSTRTAHYLVARETQFRRLRPGRYWVALEGVLEEPATEEALKRPYELRRVLVESRRTHRLEIDLTPQDCVLLVRVVWDGRPVKEASLALAGQPDSLRLARNGQAALALAPATHRLLVGCEDRVLERVLQVTRCEPDQLEIDLADPEDLVFRGCPPAVAPFLQGDLSAAARALRREGLEEIANRVQARLHEEGGRRERAAELYEKAGDTEDAIRLLLEVPPDDPGYPQACEKLADAFEETGELDRALEVLESLGESAPDHPGLDARLEGIRKRLSGRHALASDVPETEGRYEIIERIGAGGMGVVFRARDRRLNREVALKRLPENLSEHPTAVSLFQREAQAVAALNHTNIVTLFDADEQDGNFFITMELLQGSTLSQLLRRHGRFGSRDVALLGQQVAAGLAYAHELRVVHRDIKPANLFFTSDRVVKIMDFGLAKMLEEVRRGTTLVAGTPYYMAPEQASPDARSGTPADLYALGVTLFELVTGRVPFRDGDVVEAHRFATPPNPRSLAPDLSTELAALILELLMKEPDARPDAATSRDRLAAAAST